MNIFNKNNSTYEVEEISYQDMIAVLAHQEQANSGHSDDLDKAATIRNKIAVAAKKATPLWLTCR